MKQRDMTHTEADVLTEEPLLPCRSSRSLETEIFAFLVIWETSDGRSSVSSLVFSNSSAISICEASVGVTSDETSCFLIAVSMCWCSCIELF
jgi:hypothetical protein